MKYGRVLKFNFYTKTFQFIVKNKLLLILSVIFLLGFSFSVFTFGDGGNLSGITEEYLTNFINQRNGENVLKIFIDSFLGSILFFAIGFIFATSMFGIVLIPALLFVRGFIYGSTVSYLYSVYSFEGVAFHAVIILIPSLLFTIALILISIEGMKFSLKISKLTFLQNSASDLLTEFKDYCIKNLLFCVLVIFSSLADVLLSRNFLENFQGII